MSDVSALLLTIGESYTERALWSVRRQSLQPADIVVIGPSESPFHRAFNAGASRVRTEFFVQIDSDLVLDPECFADLRACVRDEVGVVTGRLRDPLLGRIGAVRLVRTRCFATVALPDTISPDTDFGVAIQALGWRRLDALGQREGPRELWHTFGEHRPEYTPLYTFSKFRLAGARCRYRHDPYTLRDLISRLHRSTHPAARLALIALGHGVFLRDTRDQLHRYEADPELDVAQSMLGAVHPGSGGALPTASTETPEQTFTRCASLGARLAASRDGASFLAALDALGAGAGDDPASLVGLLALCHGIFEPLAGGGDRGADYALLEGWLLVGK